MVTGLIYRKETVGPPAHTASLPDVTIVVYSLTTKYCSLYIWDVTRIGTLLFVMFVAGTAGIDTLFIHIL